MNYTKTLLANGLRIITVPITSFESATVTIWVGVGSRYEADKVSGVSHFLEHVVAKGSKKRPTAKAISEAVDNFGGEFNAGTAKEWTNFYISARKEKLPEAIDILADMVLNPLLEEKELEREKGVILEEMAMYEDTPIYKIGEIFENLIFEGNSLGRDIIGTTKSVTGMKRSDFVAHRDNHYSPENIVVTVAGNFDEPKTIKLIDAYFSVLKKKRTPEFTKVTYAKKGPRVLIKYKDNNQAHFELGFIGHKRGHKDKYVESVMSAILGGGMSSRLFTEVREKRGLAYAVKASPDHSLDTGYFSVYVGADIKRVDEAIKVVLDQLYGLASEKYPIEDKELTKAKEYLKGHLALSLEDTGAINSFFGLKELLLDKIETPDIIYANIDKVERTQVVAFARSMFVREKLHLAMIGPFKEEDRFRKLLL